MNYYICLLITSNYIQADSDSDLQHNDPVHKNEAVD